MTKVAEYLNAFPVERNEDGTIQCSAARHRMLAALEFLDMLDQPAFHWVDTEQVTERPMYQNLMDDYFRSMLYGDFFHGVLQEHTFKQQNLVIDSIEQQIRYPPKRQLPRVHLNVPRNQCRDKRTMNSTPHRQRR